jgi:hypothetical protein
MSIHLIAYASDVRWIEISINRLSLHDVWIADDYVEHQSDTLETQKWFHSGMTVRTSMQMQIQIQMRASSAVKRQAKYCSTKW